MTFLRALATLLRIGGFRRLFVSRVTSQGSDGIFQVALASHVLFNPEQAADARSIAMAFATVLLPYSLVGPFAGVLLDRWPRRRVLVVSQLVRAAAMLVVAVLVATGPTSVAFFGVVLLVYSINRFVLAGLGAALPHVVERDLLVSANAVSPTAGSLAYLLGGALGTGLRAMGTDVHVVMAAAVGVAGAAWAASRLPWLGPDDDVPGPRLGQVAASVAAGFMEALRVLPRRARVLLSLILLTRLPLGLLLLQTVLLFRGPLDGAHGALWFGVAAVASAGGFVLAAFVTPALAPRLGSIPFATRMLAIAAVGTGVLGWVLVEWSVAVVGFLVAFASQSVKITVDTLLQAHVTDQLLGRAFSLYDMAYNAGLVCGAVLGALVLPAGGDTPWPLLAVAAGYVALVTALGPTWRLAARRDETVPLG